MRLFLDANILRSKTLRDWFALLSIESRASASGLDVQLRVSEDVLAEWQYHLRRDHPEAAETTVGGLRRQFIASLGDDVLVLGHPGLTMPAWADRHDAHVVSAATHAQADYLVSDDRGLHEIADELEPEVYSADDALCLIADRDRALLARVARRQVLYWGSRGSERTLDEALGAAGAPRLAELVRNVLVSLAQTGHY